MILLSNKAQMFSGINEKIAFDLPDITLSIIQYFDIIPEYILSSFKQ